MATPDGRRLAHRIGAGSGGRGRCEQAVDHLGEGLTGFLAVGEFVVGTGANRDSLTLIYVELHVDEECQEAGPLVPTWENKKAVPAGRPNVLFWTVN